jgi:hypothetical protein
MDLDRHARTARDPRPSLSYDLVRRLDLEKLGHDELNSLGRVLARAGDWNDREKIVEAGSRQGLKLRFDGPDF